MRRLLNWFLQGLLLLVPIAFTGYVFLAALRSIDGWLGLETPGLGIAILVSLTTLAGFLASSFFAGRAQKAVDALFGRLPFVKLLYGAVRDLMGAFVGNERRFDRPVLVELVPGSNVRAVGFVTRESLAVIDQPDLVSVYFPQSYNFSGLMALVPRTQLTPLTLPSPDVLAFVVSGGLSMGSQGKS